MNNDMTQTPADVRGRIIRASILPIEDEETMIAGLRAGAEAVERGELDAGSFVAVWSQYLRELFRRASSVPAPADVREQVAKEVYVWEHVRRGAEESWARQRWQTETDGMRDLYFETADRILSLLRTPRGEGEGRWEDLVFGPIVEAYNEAHAALRSGAQEGEEDALVCASCGESIGDEPTVIWQDAYTHYRCTPEDAIRDDTPVIRPIDTARRGEGGGK